MAGCIYTDATHSVIGECGQDQPSFILPTHPDEMRETAGQEGIPQWQSRAKAWTESLRTMFNETPFGIVTVFPPNLQKGQAANMMDALFKTGAQVVFVTTPWSSSLIMSGAQNLTGLVVHISDNCVCFAAMCNVKSIRHSILRLPMGHRELLNTKHCELLCQVRWFYAGLLRLTVYQEITQVLMTCEDDIEELSSNIILSGNVTEEVERCFRDTAERVFRAELPHVKLGISASPSSDSGHGTWTGLSVIGCLSPAILVNPKVGVRFLALISLLTDSV